MEPMQADGKSDLRTENDKLRRRSWWLTDCS